MRGTFGDPKESGHALVVSSQDRLPAVEHLENLCRKLSKSIFRLKSLCRTAGHSVGKLIYNAYFHSHLVYCTGYWSTAPKCRLRNLEKKQKRALWVISPPGPQRQSHKQLQILHVSRTGSSIEGLKGYILARRILGSEIPESITEKKRNFFECF